MVREEQWSRRMYFRQGIIRQRQKGKGGVCTEGDGRLK